MPAGLGGGGGVNERRRWPVGLLMACPVAGFEDGSWSSFCACFLTGASELDRLSTDGFDGVDGRTTGCLLIAPSPTALPSSPPSPITSTFFADVLAPSNMEINEPVGLIDPESTATSPPAPPTLLAALIPPALSFLLGERGLGLGLAFRLAASVAAMKEGLFVSTAPLFEGWRCCCCCC